MVALTERSDKVLRRLTGGTLIIVGLAGGIQSYTYLSDLAIASGVSPYLAPLFPISVDGLIIAGSLSLLRSSLQNRRDLFAWLLVFLGSALSIWGNVVASRADGGGLVSNIVHTIPVIAMIAALESFLSALRHGYVKKSEAEAEVVRLRETEERAESRKQAQLARQANVVQKPQITKPSTRKNTVLKPIISKITQPMTPQFLPKGDEKIEWTSSVALQESERKTSPAAEQTSKTNSQSPSTTLDEANKNKNISEVVPVAKKLVSEDVQKNTEQSEQAIIEEENRKLVYEDAIQNLRNESLTKQAAAIIQAHEDNFSSRIASIEVSDVMNVPLAQARKAIERGRRNLKEVV